MNKDDVKQIKGINDSALETHLGSVHDEISNLRTEVKKDLSELEERLNGRTDRLAAKIDGISERLGTFENNEIDKRLQIAVRVTRVEKRLRLSAAT
jgi:hypothetical protein